MKDHDIIGGYMVKPLGNYWIYPVTYDLYNQITEHYKNPDIDYYLPLYQHYDIKCFDIILLWVKTAGTKNKSKIGQGIKGICQAEKSVIKNKNLKLVKDKDLQRFLIKLDNVDLFDKPIDKNKIEEKMQGVQGFSNHASFGRKYCRSELSLIKLPDNIGRLYFEAVANSIEYNYDSKEEIENKKQDIENKKIDIYTNNELFSKTRKKIIKNKKLPEPDITDSDITDSDIETISITTTFMNDLSDDSDNYDDDFNSDEDCEDTEEEVEDPEHKYGYIPIMVIPCKKFMFPHIDCDENDIDENGNTKDSLEKCTYFIDHMSKCRYCEITNNNTVELNFLLKDCVFSFMSCEQDSPDVELIFDFYYYTKKCNLFGETIKQRTIKIIYIDDKYEHYDGSIFVCVADQPDENDNNNENNDNPENNDYHENNDNIDDDNENNKEDDEDDNENNKEDDNIFDD
jgi:hypothetical protein